MIDIITYRMRIGTFGGGTKFKIKLEKSPLWSRNGFRQDTILYLGLVTTMVTIIQIRIHLLLSGDIESNPGPGIENTNNNVTKENENALTETPQGTSCTFFQKFLKFTKIVSFNKT